MILKGALGGALAGGIYGGMTAGGPEDRMRRIGMGAGLGLAGGGIAGGAIGSIPKLYKSGRNFVNSFDDIGKTAMASNKAVKPAVTGRSRIRSTLGKGMMSVFRKTKGAEAPASLMPDLPLAAPRARSRPPRSTFAVSTNSTLRNLEQRLGPVDIPDLTKFATPLTAPRSYIKPKPNQYHRPMASFIPKPRESFRFPLTYE
jgi:hypothetical protein